MRQSSTEGSRPPVLLIVLAYIGFVSLGLPDAVIGVAWPSVRDTFSLPQSALGLILFGAASGYFASSFFSGRVVHALGIGLLLAGSTALVALSALGFAAAPVWVLFLLCSVVHGLGSGAIDAGLNGYAASHLSARHMNWLHACYCLGAMLGPLLMTTVLTTTGAYSSGYALLGVLLLLLALLFLLTRPLWRNPLAAGEIHERVGTWTALRHPGVMLSMSVFFLYTGIEVTVGQWTFTVLTEARGVTTATAGVWVGIYWGSIGVGRVLFGFAVERVGIDGLLRGCLLAAIGGAVLLALPGPTESAYAGLVVIGLALAPIYPCLMTRTPQRLGSALAAHAVGFQVGAAMLGAAAVPGGVGLIVGSYGLVTMAPTTAVLAGILFALHEVLRGTSFPPTPGP